MFISGSIPLPTFNKKTICNNLKNRAIADGCDWIFPIDADEQLVLPFTYENLLDYLTDLQKLSDFHFCAFEIPYKDIFPTGEKWHEPQKKVFGRFPAQWVLSYGSHLVERVKPIEVEDGYYAHYPIRSYEQFKSKVTAYMTAFYQNPDMRSHAHARNYHLWQQQGEPFIQQLYDTCLATLQWPPE
jgi:hypothetical protein